MPTDDRIEQETTITFNLAEADALIWSADPTFQRRMGKLGVEPYKVGIRAHGQKSAHYRVPKSWVRVKPPATRQITEEQRRRLAAMSQAMRERGMSGKSPLVVDPLE